MSADVSSISSRDEPGTVGEAPRIAVVVPCYNEEMTIGKVVSGFRQALPEAEIHVYDNNSRDNTVAAARAAGAIIGIETRQGKGNVVRRMFSDVEADIYLLVDGDDTYDPAAARRMIDLILSRDLDFVNAARAAEPGCRSRPGHAFGNRVLSGLVKIIFGAGVDDMLSGYKAFSRRYVKSFPAFSRGFEIETELTVHALELRMPIGEVTAPYRDRPEGSSSKLGTFRDGWKIIATIFTLVRDERPLAVFSLIGGLLIIAALVLMIPIFGTWAETGKVPRFPTAILASAMTLAGLLSISAGLVLDTVTRGRKEMKRMFYLLHSAPPPRPAARRSGAAVVPPPAAGG